MSASKRFRVFMGPPLPHEYVDDPGPYQWQTATFDSTSIKIPSFSYPPATLEAASRRISLIYKNIIFRETDEGEVNFSSVEDSALQASKYDDVGGETTAISWPPTPAHDVTEDHHTTTIPLSRPSASVSRIHNETETQDTQHTTSYDYSDASSIFRFPTFHFNLHNVTSLSRLNAEAESARGRKAGPKASRKITVLAAVLEVDGPDAIRIKKGADAGKEVALLKLILGDEDGGICKLTAWRETAEAWGGLDPAADMPGVKKGDIVLLENVSASWEVGSHAREPGSPVSLTASPYMNPRLEICYRSMPTASEDIRLRPDLRLGLSDAAVRKVSAIVDWFEDMAGLRDPLHG